ncbi:class II histocompatibility antigen, B-L beta chain-like [Melozone crissalis]|uniref:class II histocompatibility antigen, B-L beta chain-like n=1 Tax=Melozone crissalis TaxID=40204 RepID=UPI0023DB797A|nr:class II histocompatibility antigen, B-L beta chain-like [Melozone crissalis]
MSECYFINGTEKMRFAQRYIYNREQFVMFYTTWASPPMGRGGPVTGTATRPHWSTQRSVVDMVCPYNYKGVGPLSTERRVSPSVSISLVPPSSSQPGPGRLLCSVMDFYPAAIQVRWFQGQQELSEHVVATDVVPNGDWTYQLLVLLETPPQRGLSYSCQVEHVSLEQPLRRHWEW